MDQDGNLPALRPLQITPFRGEDQQLYFELRDMLRIAPQALVLSGAGYFVLAHLDGAHTRADVQEALRRETGQAVPAAEIDRVVDVLDHYAMLDTPRFAQAYASRRAEYLSAPCRDSPESSVSAEAIRAQIGELLSGARPERMDDVLGIVAPHLDYGRGAPGYRAAYTALSASEPAERYIVLGTNHFGRSTCAVATRKDFRTPLGLVGTDRTFIARLEERLGSGLCEHEFDHATEHSIELQVQILQVLLGARTFEIVPILCPDVCGPTGTNPVDGVGPSLDAVGEALGALLAGDARRTVLIAGADLSHVGTHFGDEMVATSRFLEAVEQHDRQLLALLGRGACAWAMGRIRASGNPTRICSLGCLYVLSRAAGGAPWRILVYHQAVDPATDANVTCAAAVVSRA